MAATPVMFTVKTLYGIDVRRFDINMHEQAVVDPFTQLTSLVAVAYTLPPASILLKYRDEDNDECSISSCVELREAFRIASSTTSAGASTATATRRVLAVTVYSTLITPSSAVNDNPDDFVKVDSFDLNNARIVAAPTVASAPAPASAAAPVVVEPVAVVSPPVSVTTWSSLSRVTTITETTTQVSPTSAATPTVTVTPSPVVVATPAPVAVPSVAIVDADAPSRSDWLLSVKAFLAEPSVMMALQSSLSSLAPLGTTRTIDESRAVLAAAFSSPVLMNHTLVRRMVMVASNNAGNRDAIIAAGVEVAKVLPALLAVLPMFANQPQSLPYKDQVDRLYDAIVATPVVATPRPVVVAAPVVVPVVAPVVPVPAPVPVVTPAAVAVVAPVAVTNNSKGGAIHTGISCDGCGMHPIVGVRYKCTTCADYDNCERCEAAGVHHASHAMMKLRVPLPAPEKKAVATPTPAPVVASVVGTPGVAAPTLPEAEFINDITLPDGTSVAQGSIVRKIWRFKNTGTIAWRAGVHMTHVSGVLTPSATPATETKSSAPVVINHVVAVGSTIDISIDVRAPTMGVTADRMTGNYKLCTADGVRFGPMVWLDIRVVHPSKMVAAVAPVVVAPVVTPTPVVATPAPTPVAVAPAKVATAVTSSRYVAECAMLSSMGFTDDDLNAYLLANSRGDVQRVVDWLVKWGPAAKSKVPVNQAP